MAGLIRSELWSADPTEQLAATCAGTEAESHTVDVLATETDDKSLRYLVEVHPAFDALRRTAAQLAGLLVLAAAGTKGAAPDHPMLQAAALTHAEAADRLLGLAVTGPVCHLHYHLTEAATAIATALAAAENQFRRASDKLDVAIVLAPLRSGYDHLRHASHLLPGSTLVDLRHACCAVPSVGHSPPSAAQR